jgi:peptidoglycan/LPS O-acetylase OafA/YrhL
VGHLSVRALKARFTRVTSSGAVIPELDGIRMLALLCVLAHHVMAAYLVQTERFGKISLPRDWYLVAPRDWFIDVNLHAVFAVRVFFALSGLIVSLPFARRYRAGLPARSARSFYLGRLVRIAPPYILSCLVFFLWIVLPFRHHNPAAYFHAFFPHLVASLFYLHGTTYGHASWINGVAWTLEVEAQFYLIAPAIALLFLLRPASVRRIAMLGMMLAFSLLTEFYITPSGHPRLQMSVLSHLQYFLAGCLATDLILDRWISRKRSSLLGDGIFMLSAVTLFVVMMKLPRLNWLLPFFVPSLYYGALDGKFTSRILRSPWMAIPGGMCYSIFLYHPLVIQLAEPYMKRLNVPAWPVWADFAVLFAVLFVPILIFSAVLYALAERPFMSMSRKLALRERARAQDAKTTDQPGMVNRLSSESIT